MTPFPWTKAMQGAIRTSIAVAELQTVMMLRTMALFGLFLPGGAARMAAPPPAPAPAPAPARKPARKARVPA